MSNNKTKYDVSLESEEQAENCRIEICMVPMRDGVKLDTVVYLPEDNEKHHVVLVRSPYNPRDTVSLGGKDILEQGMIYIVQSCRGSSRSGGDFVPFKNERKDAEDTFAWIRQQSWFGGRVAMTGGSYCGLTQWLGAIGDSPELVAITPGVSCSNIHDKLLIGGAFFLQLHMHWGMSMYVRCVAKDAEIGDWDKENLASHLPLLEIDEAAGLGRVDYWRDWLEKCDDQDYWEEGAINHNYEKITAPAYMYGGWYDFYNAGTVENFIGMRTRGGSEKARKFTRCVMGPWGHGGLKNPDIFGEENNLDRVHEMISLYRKNILEAPDVDPLPDEPPMRYFVMGSNQWRESDCWPPEGVEEKCFYIHSNDCANTRFGAGRLDCVKPGSETADTYIYDPRNPVPSRGGCFSSPGENGCVDQRDVEERSDVLVYVSEELDSDIEIAGQVKVRLFAATNSLDTDFTAKLVDIYPDGRVLNICDGIIRARYRNGLFKPELLEPGEIYEYEIDCWHTANRFLRGHRIGLDISSSNFPRFDRNPNTGHALGVDAELRPARQVIYHDSEHPSCVILPVTAE